jgi:hypothetical protein
MKIQTLIALLCAAVFSTAFADVQDDAADLLADLQRLHTPKGSEPDRYVHTDAPVNVSERGDNQCVKHYPPFTSIGNNHSGCISASGNSVVVADNDEEYWRGMTAPWNPRDNRPLIYVVNREMPMGYNDCSWQNFATRRYVYYPQPHGPYRPGYPYQGALAARHYVTAPPPGCRH